jgi:hypothetical protein
MWQEEHQQRHKKIVNAYVLALDEGADFEALNCLPPVGLIQRPGLQSNTAPLFVKRLIAVVIAVEIV